jgi:hypothetical protein
MHEKARSSSIYLFKAICFRNFPDTGSIRLFYRIGPAEFSTTLCIDMKTTPRVHSSRVDTSAALFSTRLCLATVLLATTFAIAACGGSIGDSSSAPTSGTGTGGTGASGPSGDGKPTTTSNVKLDCAPAP